MLYVDSRTGSKEFIGSFAPHGIETELAELEFADFCFTGNGPCGQERSIGIERKHIQDILTCIRDGRFSGHQLPGLLSTYHRVVLVIEGMWRPARDGMLEELGPKGWAPARGRFMYRELTAFLLSMREICNLQIERTCGKYETVMAITTWYKWYTEKKWDEHSAHKTLHDAPIKVDRKSLISATFDPPPPPTLVRRIANQIDLIAGKRSEAVDEHFRSVHEMVNAEEKEWQKIDGIGKKISTDVYRALREVRAGAARQAGVEG